MGNYDLQVCECGHEQICFVGRHCPPCAEVAKVEELQKDIKTLEDRANDE
jgi:hypothetical protein